MMKLLTGIFLLGSISSYATAEMKISESFLSSGEISALIIEPRYPGTGLPIRFDDWIKEDGVCKLLGYERAVPRSSIFSGWDQRVIMLDRNGNIEKLRNDTDSVTQIACINRLNNTSPEEKKVVNNPVHPDSLIPLRFDDWYKEDGVCKLLGYESAVPRSSIFGGYEERVIMLNRNGNIEKLRNDTDSVTEIVCVKHF